MKFNPFSIYQQKLVRVIGKIESSSNQLVPRGRIFTLIGEDPYSHYDGGRYVKFSGFTIWCADSEPNVFESLQEVETWYGDIDYFSDFKLGGPTVLISIGAGGLESLKEYFSKQQNDPLNSGEVLNLSDWCSDFAVCLKCEPNSLKSEVTANGKELNLIFTIADVRTVADFIFSVVKKSDESQCLKLATERMQIILSWQEYTPGFWCLHSDPVIL